MTRQSRNRKSRAVDASAVPATQASASAVSSESGLVEAGDAGELARQEPDEEAIQQAIEEGRTQLLQAQAVLRCLYEVLLYADGKDALAYADVASVAGRLVGEVAERLDIAELKARADRHARADRLSEDELPLAYGDEIPPVVLRLMDIATEIKSRLNKH